MTLLHFPRISNRSGSQAHPAPSTALSRLSKDSPKASGLARDYSPASKRSLHLKTTTQNVVRLEGTFLVGYQNLVSVNKSLIARYNKYAQVAAKVIRNSLKDEARVAAARRNEMSLKYAKWENGKQGEVVSTMTVIKTMLKNIQKNLATEPLV